MKASRFEVLDSTEMDLIHAVSMDLLGSLGVRVEWPTARELFRQAGAHVDDEQQRVRIPEHVVWKALEMAPDAFGLWGLDLGFGLDIGGGQPCFAGLGTPTHIVDHDGQRRATTLDDVVRHIQLINGCQRIHNSQMDVWPNDVPMTTIHTESIWAWAHHSRKPFGMGCFGYLPTLDMMRMMAIAVGGKQELRQHPRFFAICSVGSPLQMLQMQLEGMLICADYGQPIAMSPEAIAGATAPVTLAGLIAQQNASILAHVVLSQVFRPGTPVLYGTVSTIANMRLGTVALGAFETGLITAAAAQMARFYGLPCRSVGGTTDSKLEDVQAGMERTATLLQAVLAGVDFVTCAGTLDGTMMESDALLILDDELAGAALRVARGIEVDRDTLALDIIKEVVSSGGGNFLAHPHTARRFRHEHFIPSLLAREPYDVWAETGGRSALDRAKERAAEILARHEPRYLEESLQRDLDDYRKMVARRPLDQFYLHENEEMQDWSNL